MITLKNVVLRRGTKVLLDGASGNVLVRSAALVLINP